MAAASGLLTKTLASTIELFHNTHDGQAAAQVVVLSDEPLAPLSARARQLIKVKPKEEERNLAAWHAKVAAFGAGILVFVAAAGGIICLCIMPTGQDSMLFQRQKTD